MKRIVAIFILLLVTKPEVNTAKGVFLLELTIPNLYLLNYKAGEHTHSKSVSSTQLVFNFMFCRQLNQLTWSNLNKLSV